ncbi:MAG: STAS domain-containing protein [Pseudolabrys sp.]|nr:STAS domain-containing protein [Pseudolabrys sp.]
MEITIEDLPGHTKASLSGRFDTTGAIAIELPFNTLANERRALVIDLSNVTFMSSYGIRVLLRGGKIAMSKGAKLVIFCPDTAVSKVLTRAGTSDLIPVYPTLSAATAAVS